MPPMDLAVARIPSTPGSGVLESERKLGNSTSIISPLAGSCTRRVVDFPAFAALMYSARWSSVRLS